jgi:oligoendopeptidase F
MFANYELEAHRLVERGEPVTAESLSRLFSGIFKHFFGDAVAFDDLLRVTWARIPHFYGSPYYVYQYATCFASSARIHQWLRDGDAGRRGQAVDRYLTLLRSGSKDHPMALLQAAGVDLSQPETVRAIVDHLDGLVTRLEGELAAFDASSAAGDRRS